MRLTVIVLLFLFSITAVNSQKTSVYVKPEADYKLAVELFNKEKYAAAQKLFEKVIDQVDEKDSELKINSYYYKAICALELFHPDAEVLLTYFLNQHPIHPKKSIASFQMGNLQYRNRKYEDALAWYDKVDMFDLDRHQKEEYTFKRGYAYFTLDDFENAKRLLFDIRNPNSVYFAPAMYYYGHIAYMEKNYETALRSFNKLTDDSNFGPVVPYYITHIYYLQGRYDELLEYAPPLLEEASIRRVPEIARLIGDAHYSKNNYAEAIPYLEDFRSQTRERLTRDDYYQLAYSYYRVENCENAKSLFERITTGEDSLAQNAYYLLADCYLKTGDRRAARNAFRAANEMDFIPKIKQDALFNYAKLSYELSYSPFNEAIISFQKYIEEYPDSPRISEAYEYLIDLFLTTRNYRDAMASMENITINTPRLREAYQRIAYYRGVELFNNGDFRAAIDYFNRSLKYPDNNTIRAQCIYWIGESYYRMDDFDKAIEYHNRFLVTPGAFNLEIYNRANYNIGYSYFNKKQYEDAITAFRKFITARDEGLRLLNDAYLRLGDSYFITKKYRNAIDYYDRALEIDLIDSDYAFFQKSMAQGAIGNFEAKARSLNLFMQKYPESNYLADAKYELANTYMMLDDANKALSHYSMVIDDHPNSSYVKSAMLKKGLIYYNEFEDEKAIEQLKSVADNYTGTEQSQEALETMRMIYVNLDRVDEYVKYTEELGIGDITVAQQDSLTYIAAENRYMQGDCENAVRSFNNYIERFPDGIFSINANYYNAECYYRRNEPQRALRGYEYVAEKPKNRFSENATLRAASINYNLGNYIRALEHFEQLEEIAEYRNNLMEARIGQMRCHYNTERFNQAINAAKSVVQTDKVPDNILQEAFLIKGNSSLNLNQLDQAKDYFLSASEKASNEMSAEAKYNIALIEFRKGNYEKCEELIFEYINHITAYEYWLAKMFILLADNYSQQGNVFQAKHTLQSIIDNYDGDELVAMAKNRLENIEEQEQVDKDRMKDEEESFEIDF